MAPAFVVILLLLVGVTCYCIGSNRERNRTLPELLNLREEISHLRAVSGLSVCPRCRGQQALYNHLTENYYQCPRCKGAGEVKEA